MRLGLIAIAAVFAATSVWAHQGATGIVKERMDAMKSVKGAMKILAPIMKGDVAYDAGVVRIQAEILAAKGGSNMTDMFPKGSTQHPSEALPAIWKDWDEFVEIANRLETSAIALATNAANPRDGSATDPWKAFDTVVGTCRACHDDFRKE